MIHNNKLWDSDFSLTELNQVICKYEKDKRGLDILLSNQMYANDRSRLGYSKHEYTIFIKYRNAYNNVQTRKVHNNFQ